MKVVFFILLCFPLHVSANDLKETFAKYIERYNKTYVADANEYSTRFEVFKENKEIWMKLNSSDDSAIYGPTKFSDLSSKEFKDQYLTCFKGSEKQTHVPLQRRSRSTVPLDRLNIPKKIDWRHSPSKFSCRNCVTPVKNQKSCGACWAFAVVETVESMKAIKTSTLKALSVQQVIDCSQSQPLHGCGGGDTCSALAWMNDTLVSLVTEKEYPFVDKTQHCKESPSPKPGVSINNYSCKNYITAEQEVLELLATYGPVTVSVDATSWQNYQGGVIQHHCGETRNHAVQIVGYDLTGEVPYYIVRNSWGADFGHKGYLYVKYGDNVCDIVGEVSTVYVL